MKHAQCSRFILLGASFLLPFAVSATTLTVTPTIRDPSPSPTGTALQDLDSHVPAPKPDKPQNQALVTITCNLTSFLLGQTCGKVVSIYRL